MEKEELLVMAKDLLKEELTSIGYATWIHELKIEDIIENNIVLKAKSTFQKDAVETRYHDLILNTFKYITNKNYTFSVILDDPENTANVAVNKVFEEKAVRKFSPPTLNQNYIFNTFVVGGNNSLAHAVALNVAESPGRLYNPLFIYGGVGLGKTHLMHAIGNKILENNRNANVLYVPSEQFANEFVNSLKNATVESFKNKYRTVDILLIDDIQFIAGKESTQEEFFHTFNALRDNGKQIVLSSDKPPKEIKKLEERLVSRFEWGCAVDINLPDYETRLAILQKKAQEQNIIIDNSILANIADRVSSSIRELEGVLLKIVAYASISSGPITMEMSEKAINAVTASKEKILSSEYIQEVVCKYFDISLEDIISAKRSSEITFPRQIAMYICRNVANISLPSIGDSFGGRDHSTVIHACNKIEKEIEQKLDTKLIVESVKKIILQQHS